MSRIYFIALLSSFLSLFSFPSLALELTENQAAYCLKQASEYYVSTPEDGLALVAEKTFLPSPPGGGIYEQPIWSKLKFNNQSGLSNFVLKYDIIIGKMSVFVADENGTKEYHSGLFSGNSDSLVGQSAPAIPLELGKSGTIYIRYDYDDPISFDARLFTTKAYAQNLSNDSFYIGSYTFLIFCVLIVSIWLFLTEKKFIYISYIFSVVFTSAGYLMIYGYFTDFVISPEVFRYWNLANILGLGMTISNIALFAQSILKPKGDLFFKAISWMLGLSSTLLLVYFLLFPTNATASWAVNITIMASQAFALLGSLLLVRRGVGNAFFLLGWILTAGSGILITLAIQGEIEQSWRAKPLLFFTSFAEIILLYISVRILLKNRNEAKVQAENRLREISRFFSNLAHDFKSPFAELRNVLDALCNSSFKMDPDFLFKRISFAADYVEGLCFDFTMTNSQNLLCNEKVALADEIESVVTLISNRHDLAEGSIIVGFESGIGLSQSNKVAIRRVLFNLIENAVQEMKKHLAAGPGIVVIAASSTNDGIKVQVSNRNFGLQQSDAVKFFTDGYSTKTNGNGFGLTVVKDLAAKLGGSVACEVNLDKVIFSLSFAKNIA